MFTPLRLLKSLARHVFANRANLLLENLAVGWQNPVRIGRMEYSCPTGASTNA